jgi:hypothetical protein
MSTTMVFQQGDTVRVYRDSALAAVETATVLRMTDDGGVRLRFRTDGHETTWRHGQIELATLSPRHHFVA